MVIELTQDRRNNAFRNMAETLLLTVALTETMPEQEKLRDFETVLLRFEAQTTIDDQEWLALKQIVPAGYTDSLLAGLWARLRYYGLARAKQSNPKAA